MRAADVMLRVCGAGRFLDVSGPAVLPWSDRDMVRLALRQPLLVAAGLPDSHATKTANRLTLRDQDCNSRRMCLECSNLLIPTRCKKGIAAVHVLQRCPRFTFKVPQ